MLAAKKHPEKENHAFVSSGILPWSIRLHLFARKWRSFKDCPLQFYFKKLIGRRHINISPILALKKKKPCFCFVRNAKLILSSANQINALCNCSQQPMTWTNQSHIYIGTILVNIAMNKDIYSTTTDIYESYYCGKCVHCKCIDFPITITEVSKHTAPLIFPSHYPPPPSIS